MWNKLVRGVVVVRTRNGVHYIRPGFFECVRLLWIFRHFTVLPENVLGSRQRRFVESLCVKARPVIWGVDMNTQCIGTIEWNRPAAKPASGVKPVRQPGQVYDRAS
ncbi:MAG TPA: hypothetical protein VK473_16150 [Terriglobales bacterium]|nr:hypothetical protein [Terriglobales bacterium]